MTMETAGLAGLAPSASTFVPRHSRTTRGNQQQQGQAAAAAPWAWCCRGSWRRGLARSSTAGLCNITHDTHDETDTGAGWGQRATTPRSQPASQPPPPRALFLITAGQGRGVLRAGWLPRHGRSHTRRRGLVPTTTGRRPRFLLRPTATACVAEGHRCPKISCYVSGRRGLAMAVCMWPHTAVPAAAAAAAGLHVEYLLDSRRGGPAEAGGKRWKPTACRFIKNLTE